MLMTSAVKAPRTQHSRTFHQESEVFFVCWPGEPFTGSDAYTKSMDMNVIAI